MRGQGLQGLSAVVAPALVLMSLAAPGETVEPLAEETAADEASAAPAAPAGAIADSELGLSRGSVFDVPSPPPVVEIEAEPGESVRFPRAYPGAPPQIPHAVADLLPITRSENLCLDCHAVEIEEPGEGDPTPIPGSHYLDLRNAPTVRRDTVAGARHYCLSCHLPPTVAAPLVANPARER